MDTSRRCALQPTPHTPRAPCSPCARADLVFAQNPSRPAGWCTCASWVMAVPSLFLSLVDKGEEKTFYCPCNY